MGGQVLTRLAKIVSTSYFFTLFFTRLAKYSATRETFEISFFELSKQIWDADHSTDKRCFSQRLRRLRKWSQKNISGPVLNKVESLCQKRMLCLLAFDHPNGHRTSNRLDRVMRSMNRYFDQGFLHGSLQVANRHARAWTLLYHFSPWHPATTRFNKGWQSPAERIININKPQPN